MLALVGALRAPVAQAQESADPYANETPAQRDARMKWWREARFGMFIHWGVYSVPAGFYHDKPVDGIGEWIMNSAKIPTAEYQAFAKQFNPVKFNAEEWVKLAKDAGMKYIVITSKHHDGFAMFDSKASDWNIVKASPFGRDPLKELAAACQKNGIKLGFYYSQAQDWNNPGGAAAGGHWDKAQDGDMTEYIRKVAAPQVKEILTGYGPIAVIWWDTQVDMTKERADLLLPLLKLQPGIIHNNRLGGGYNGDTETPEQFIPATGFPGRDWETCMTLNDTWGFKSNDHNWKSTETLVRNLIDIASKGGNYLLNVGPTSEGLIPEPSVQRLKEVAAWMKVNGSAIYATSASPFKRLPWGRCTTQTNPDGTTLFLHVFQWPGDGKLLVPGLKNAAKSATLLANGTELKTESTPDGVVIHVPAAAPDAISSTVVLKITGTPEVEPFTLSQKSDGSLELQAFDAALHGSTFKTEGSQGSENIGYWINSDDYADWTIKVTKPGKFVLSVETAALSETAYEVQIGDQKLTATAPKTGSYTDYKVTEIGKLDVAAAGNAVITVRPRKEGWQPINLRKISIRLE